MNKFQLLFIGLGLFLLGALFWAFKPSETASTQAPSMPASRVVAGASATAQSDVANADEALESRFEFVVHGGRLEQGPARMSVQKGGKVVLSILSDVNDQLHLHGYDESLALTANVPAKLEFEARIAGRFELELHHSGVELGALEVMP